MNHAGTTWAALLNKPSVNKVVVRLHKMPPARQHNTTIPGGRSLRLTPVSLSRQSFTAGLFRM